jgi:diacylglycerol kinase family enzyme
MRQTEPRVTVILNAGAGGGHALQAVERLRSKFAAAGLQPDVRQVRGEQIHAETRNAVAAGVGAVVAGGGDGTVSAVAAMLCGTTTPLGVLPMGTLNHFAKDLGIPLDEDAAIANVAAGHCKAVDVGEVNGRVFINNSSLGLYPDIVRERNHRQHRLGHGKWRALLDASINAARRYPVLDVTVELDGQTLARRTPFVFIGNNAYTMEGFEIGERRALDQGLLSLYLTHRMGRFGLLQLAVRALLHRLQQARDFDVVAAQQFTVHTHHRHLRVATDGEASMMNTPLRYSTRPGALQVIVPAAPQASAK